MEAHDETSKDKLDNVDFKRKYPKKLGGRILLFCVFFGSILSAVIIQNSVKGYRSVTQEVYEEYEESILKTVIKELDAEGIKESIQTKKKNNAYKDMEEDFRYMVENEVVKYIFALYFDDKGDLYYVTNGHTEETDPLDVHELGDLPREGDFGEERRNKLYKFVNGSDELTHISFIDAKGDKLMSANIKLLDKEGNVVCFIGVDLNKLNLTTIANRYRRSSVIYVITISAILLALMFLILNRYVISPIKRLSHSAKNLISQQEHNNTGELVYEEIPIHTRDEIQLLSDSLNSMVAQLNDYIHDVSDYVLEQERINLQFGFVQKLKENLFPVQFPVFQERLEFDIYAKIKFSKVSSGDFYDFFLVDANHICFFVGSASGNGVMSTMVAMIATIYMENFARLGYLPNRILGETNNRLSENNVGDNNMGEITVNTFIGIVDLRTGKFTYSQVGERAPLIKLSGEDADRLVSTAGYSLGSLENVAYPQHTIYLTQGESIFIYTDGVPTRKNKKGFEFTDEYVIQMWNEAMKQDYELDRIVNGMIEQVEKYAEGTEQEEDETMLVFRYQGK